MHTLETTETPPVQETNPEPPASSSKSRLKNPELEAAIGARIRAARLEVGMSQKALSEAVSISSQQVQKYELGKDRVAASTLQAIAAALGVHPGSFFDDAPAPVGPVSDVRAAMRAADVLPQIRDPRVLKQLLALAKVLAAPERAEVGAPEEAPDAGDVEPPE